MMKKYAGAKWLQNSMKIENMSPLGVEVADFLGDLFYGLYHMNRTSLLKVNWDDDFCIKATIPGGRLATVDAADLTRIVVMAHDRMLRVDIDGAAYGYLHLMFHKRKHRTLDEDGASLYNWHPTLEEHIKMIRG